MRQPRIWDFALPDYPPEWTTQGIKRYATARLQPRLACVKHLNRLKMLAAAELNDAQRRRTSSEGCCWMPRVI
jgi:hypothetical protein